MAKPALVHPTNLTNHTSFAAVGLMPTPGVGYSRNVYIEGRPAIPAGSKFIVHDIPTDVVSVLIRPPHNDEVAEGCPNVFCNGQPLARIGDKIRAPKTFHPAPNSPAGSLRSGATTVNVSDLPPRPFIG
jgi:uncharacterized Zn-binding protein involved in type VI secretion